MSAARGGGCWPSRGRPTQAGARTGEDVPFPATAAVLVGLRARRDAGRPPPASSAPCNMSVGTLWTNSYLTARRTGEARVWRPVDEEARRCTRGGSRAKAAAFNRFCARRSHRFHLLL